VRFNVKLARSGAVVADRYRLEEPLGQGAMGTVWRAEHLRLKSPVAVKLLDPAIADDPEMLERFVREAESAAAVRGPHVVQIFDCGVEGGAPYITMELLNGESLHTRLQKCTTITPAELNKIFSEVASAVGHAHELGVIHRDLKPANIFLARVGEHEITKVLDFGIAKVLHSMLADGSGAGTRTGTLLGTPHYMSPEQARGSRTLDQRSDLWSLAVIAFECLTGERPFLGDAIGDVVVQICTAAPRLPSAIAEVPAGFDEWFLQGASKDPNRRFSSAREMADALGEILARAISSPVTRLGGFHVAEQAPLTLASSPGSGPPSHDVPPSHDLPPRSATLELRRPTGTVTGLLSSAVQRLGDRPRWLLWAPPLLSLGAVLSVVLWPRSEPAAPAFGSTALQHTDTASAAPARPDHAASAPAVPAPVAAPAAGGAAVAVLPAGAPATPANETAPALSSPLGKAADRAAAATPDIAERPASVRRGRQRFGSQPTAQRVGQRPGGAKVRKSGVSKSSRAAAGDARPAAEPGSAGTQVGAQPPVPQRPKPGDPFTERL
jgi:serine/threonine-protein kinase